ncbi:MAG: CdaR family protein [Oscillospiraceae bacterium]|nr:CdaR family protein [Oscillospiraceae bacterium]
MIRERINRFFSSKAFYTCFSLLVAIALWVYIEISVNDMQTHIVSNVRVVTRHEEVLQDRGLFLSSLGPQSVSVTFECTRIDASKLSRETLVYVVDLSNINSIGPAAIIPQLESSSDIDLSIIEYIGSVEQIFVNVDGLEMVTIPVEVVFTGGTAEGFVQDPIEFMPQSITVSGPFDLVSTVSKAQVNVLRENLSITYIDDLPLVLIDDEGNALDTQQRNQLTISDSRIHVTVPIRVMKEIALTIDTSQIPGSAGATAQNTNITITPATITVAGRPEELRNFNSINLGTIDLTRVDYFNTFTYAIVIPNNFTNISSETEAHVQVEITGLEIQHFTVTNIQSSIVPAGYSVEIRTQSLDVRIRGKADDLENLTQDNIRVIANLPTDLSTGTQQVSARIIIDGIDADIGAVGSYFITMHIVRE